jgi:alpha-D-ribose 1-methylphosphonate 5-triphosphate synthase subunit PhnG
MNTPDHIPANALSLEISARRAAMGLLARATESELAGPISANWPDHAARDLKPTQSGLVMVRGRTGGDGAAFNLGEASVTRAVIELPTGERGYGHVLGRNQRKARLAAIADALMQQPASRAAVEALILAPVASRLSAERTLAQTQTAATRVDFFTMVRGEDSR